MPHGQHGVGLKSGTQEVRQDLKFKAILSYTVNLRPAYDAKTLPLKEKRKKMISTTTGYGFIPTGMATFYF